MKLSDTRAIGPAKALLLLALAIQLHLALSFRHSRNFLLRSGRPEERRLNRRLDVMLRECDEHTDLISQTIRDITRITMPEALRRLERLETKLKDEPGEDAEWEGIDRSTLLTFETLFDTVYGGVGHKDNPSYMEKLQKVKRMVGKVNAVLQDKTEDYIDFIYCNDDFLTKDVPKHITDMKLEANEYFDSRPLSDGGDQKVIANYRCQSKDEDVYAFTFSNQYTEYGDSEVIVLCPSALSKAKDSPKLRSLRRTELEGKHVDDLGRENLALVRTLTHELFHSKIILGQEAAVDHSFGGWQEILLLLEEHPDYPVSNAESLTFFVLCMGLNKHDWSTGLGRPLLEVAKLTEK